MISRADIKEAFSLRKNIRELFVPPAQQIALLDGLRALAILLVFVCHLVFFAQMYIEETDEQFRAFPEWMEILTRGDLGVDVFFVLSGFLIGSILFREFNKSKAIRIKRFFLRRFMRLMPVYWFALLSSAVVVYFKAPLEYHAISFPKNIDWIWTNLLYINNFFPSEQQYAPMAHSWSLAVEEQFYFVCPFLILLFMKSRIRLHPVKVCLFFLITYLGIRGIVRLRATDLMMSKCGYTLEQLDRLKDISLTITRTKSQFCLFSVEIDVVYDNLYSKYIALFAGIVGAYLKEFRLERITTFFEKQHRGTLLGVLALGLFVFNFVDMLVFDSFKHVTIYRTFFYQPILSFSLVYLIFMGLYARGFLAAALRRFLEARLWFPIAQLSYSMYLFHVGMIGLWYELMVKINPDYTLKALLIEGGPIAFLLTLLGSGFCYVLLEKPIMNLRHVFDRS
jgi:peptidoglycan/LPS O-acetylase OafA/YrhL